MLIVTALIDARYATGQAILMAAALLVYALPFGRVNRQLQKQLDAARAKARQRLPLLPGLHPARCRHPAKRRPGVVQ